VRGQTLQVAIGRRKRSHDVAEQIERMISAGEVGIGEQLPSEKEMMERFGVGRPAVREALFLLQQQGLIEVQSGTRARVVPPTSRMLQAQLGAAIRRLAADGEGQDRLEQARLLFETGCAWLAASLAAPDDLARLKRALDANTAAVGRTAEFVRTDVAFHYEIVAVARNPIFTTVHEIMVEWLIDQRTTTIHMPDADQFSVRDHTAIFEAIAARDPARAHHEMASHLKLISQLYREAKRLADSILREVTRDVADRVRREQQATWAASLRAPAPAGAAADAAGPTPRPGRGRHGKKGGNGTP
jgi:GntR family transcriptional regulator, sialic acid-inducible nan operon repressor